MGWNKELTISFDEYGRMQKKLMGVRHPNLIAEEPQNEQVKNFIKGEKDRWALKNLMEVYDPRVSMKCPHCGKSLNVGVYPGCEDAIYDGFGGKIRSHKKICSCGKIFFINRFTTNS
jgi:hypothetical protein